MILEESMFWRNLEALYSRRSYSGPFESDLLSSPDTTTRVKSVR